MSPVHKLSAAAREKSQAAVSQGLVRAAAKRAKAAEAALRTVYWLVTEEVANRKYG